MYYIKESTFEDTLIVSFFDQNDELYSIEDDYRKDIDFSSDQDVKQLNPEILVYYSENQTFPKYKIFRLKITDERTKLVMKDVIEKE